MRGANSAPTERVLDVIELLSEPRDRPLRFSDVVRELDLSQATAHAILKTLSDRGWLSRDPATKVFSPGPALTMTAARLDAARPLVVAARDAVRRLTTTTGMAASVIERTGEELVLAAFERPKDSVVAPSLGERIPYMPPFGVAFAAWDRPDRQEAWIRRAAADDAALTEQLHSVLSQTRKRGFDVDWMTPALAQAAQVLGSLSDDALPNSMRSVIDQLRVEFTSAAVSAEDKSRPARPVATISAPVLDAAGDIELVLAVHPLQPMTNRDVKEAAQPLLGEISQLSETAL